MMVSDFLWGGVGWGGVGCGEWFVHERVEHVCKEAKRIGLKHFT